MTTQFTTHDQIIIYQGEEGHPRIEVRVESETVWLTQQQIAELFDKGRSTISEHIKNVFVEGELQEKVVCQNFRQTTLHGAIPEKTQNKFVSNSLIC